MQGFFELYEQSVRFRIAVLLSIAGVYRYVLR